MNDEELTGRVRDLRAAGSSPKEIARALGIPKSKVVPLVRSIAAADDTPIGERELAGCWVSPGWAEGLTFDPRPEWQQGTPTDGTSGIAAVLVARRGQRGRVSACGYLADVYCLGVKNAVPPRVMDHHALDRFVGEFFSGFDAPPVAAPLDLAQHLVFGAVDYARALGFEPHADFAAAAGHLGQWSGQSPIGFGRNGKPFYIEGPHDNAASVYKTLERSVGRGNFDFSIVTF
jgi:hypothetical protein